MEQGIPAPCGCRSDLCLSLINHIRVDQCDQRRANDRYEEEPEGSHAAEERSEESEHARDHEEHRTDAMGFIPYVIAGERPRRADADEEVALCSAEHKADEEEQDAHGRQHGFAHAKVGIAQVPAQCQGVHVEHERDDQRDEQVEHISELGNVGLERVDAGNDQEQHQHSQGHQRHQEHAPEPGHVAVHLVIRTPMGCHWLRQLVPKYEAGNGGSRDHE